MEGKTSFYKSNNDIITIVTIIPRQNPQEKNLNISERHKSQVKQIERLSIFLVRESQHHKVVNPPKFNFYT